LKCIISHKHLLYATILPNFGRRRALAVEQKKSYWMEANC